MLVKEVGERGKWSSGVLAEVAEQAGASEIVLDQTSSFLLSTSRFLLDVLLDVLHASSCRAARGKNAGHRPLFCRLEMIWTRRL